MMMDISDIAGENSPSPSSHTGWQQREELLHCYLFTGSLLYIMGVELKDSERHWAGWFNGVSGQLGPIQALEDLTLFPKLHLGNQRTEGWLPPWWVMHGLLGRVLEVGVLAQVRYL